MSANPENDVSTEKAADPAAGQTAPPPEPPAEVQASSSGERQSATGPLYDTKIRAEHIKTVNASQDHRRYYVGSAKDLEDLLHKQDLKLEDVATPIPANEEDHRFRFADADRQSWAEALERKHLLILSSFDQQVLFAASQDVFAGPPFASHKRYLTRLGATTCPVESLQPLVRHPPETPVFLVVEAYEQKSAAPFLDEVSGSPGAVAIARSQLGQDFLVVLTNDRVLGRSSPNDGRHDEGHVPYYPVPFLLPRLRRCFTDESQARELHDAVLRQQRAGLWGEGDERLCELLSTFLGRKTLQKEIARRDRPQTEAPTVRARLSPKTPLENAVLFLSAFFPRLPMRDFERLLLRLLGERQVETRAQPQFTSGVWNSYGDQTTDRRALREVWKETYPEVMAACQLTSEVPAGANGQPRVATVELSPSELREEVRDLFLGPHYPLYFDFFSRVRDLAFLFDESPRVVDHTVDLMTQMALSSPEEFAGPGLGGVVRLDAPDPAAPPEPLVRLYPLLRAFLQMPPLRDRTTMLFREMFDARRFDALMELAWRLRGVAQFKALPWLKRIFDEGPHEAKQRAYVFLFRAAHSGGIGEILQEVFEWLPLDQTSTASGEAATSLFLQLNVDLLLRPRRVRKGWPPSHPLLAVAAQESDLAFGRLAVQWLFHPALVPSRDDQELVLGWYLSWLVPSPLRLRVQNEDGDIEEHVPLAAATRWASLLEDPDVDDLTVLDAVLLPALILADWAVELLAEEPPAPQALALFEQLLATTVEQCTPARRQTLSLLWSVIEESLLDLLIYLEELDSLPPSLDPGKAADLRLELQARRRCVRRLRLDLQSRRRQASTD